MLPELIEVGLPCSMEFYKVTHARTQARACKHTHTHTINKRRRKRKEEGKKRKEDDKRERALEKV